jgi:hypothetical protein
MTSSTGRVPYLWKSMSPQPQRRNSVLCVEARLKDRARAAVMTHYRFRRGHVYCRLSPLAGDGPDDSMAKDGGAILPLR